MTHEQALQAMLEYLCKEELEHRSGEMMSLAEAVHGEVCAKQHREHLQWLLKQVQE